MKVLLGIDLELESDWKSRIEALKGRTGQKWTQTGPIGVWTGPGLDWPDLTHDPTQIEARGPSLTQIQKLQLGPSSFRFIQFGPSYIIEGLAHFLQFLHLLHLRFLSVNSTDLHWRTQAPNHTHVDLDKSRNSPQNTNLAILDSEEELEEEEEELHEAILCWGPGFSHGSRVGASGRQTKAKNGRKSREKKNQRGVDRIEPKAPFLQESGTGARRRTCDCWNSFTSKDER